MFRLRLRQRSLLVPPAYPSPAAAGAASVCSSCRLQFTTISRRNAQKITWHEQHFSFAWRLRHEILVMIRSTRGHKHDATNNRNNSNSNYSIATAAATTARRCRRRSRRRRKRRRREKLTTFTCCTSGVNKVQVQLLSSNRGSDKRAKGQLATWENCQRGNNNGGHKTKCSQVQFN